MQLGFLKLQKTRLGLPTVAVICCLENFLFRKTNAARHCLSETLLMVINVKLQEYLHGLRIKRIRSLRQRCGCTSIANIRN
jgi:hypothetical protein